MEYVRYVAPTLSQNSQPCSFFRHVRYISRWKVKAKFNPRRLGKSGLKVSKIILGAMSFGKKSTPGMNWTLSEDQALPILKHAYDLGINTWDTVKSPHFPHPNPFNTPTGRHLRKRRFRAYHRARPRKVLHPPRARSNPLEMLRGHSRQHRDFGFQRRAAANECQ